MIAVIAAITFVTLWIGWRPRGCRHEQITNAHMVAAVLRAAKPMKEWP